MRVLKPQCRALGQGRRAICQVCSRAGIAEATICGVTCKKTPRPQDSASFTQQKRGEMEFSQKGTAGGRDGRSGLPRAARNSWQPGRRHSCTLMETWMGAEAKSCSFSPACS